MNRVRMVLVLAVASGCSFAGEPGTQAPADADAATDTADAASPDAPPDPVCAPLPSGAEAWWDGEVLGNDILGNFSTFTTFGDPSVGPGLVGNAMLLEENEDVIVEPVPEPASFTIEGWIRREKDDLGYMTIYGHGNVAGVFLLDHRVVYYDESTDEDDVVQGATTIAMNVDHHIAVTYDGATVTVYVDGVQDGATAADDVALPGRGRIGGVIFSVGDGDGNDFVGRVDELTLYNRALSSTEINSIVTARELGKCKPGTSLAK